MIVQATKRHSDEATKGRNASSPSPFVPSSLRPFVPWFSNLRVLRTQDSVLRTLE